MGKWFSTERDRNSTAAVEEYCRSIIFIRFYGQTSCMSDQTDHASDGWSVLGKHMSHLDKEIRKAKSPSEFEITDEIRQILRIIADERKCAVDCENVDACYERLLKDAERFAEMYRKRAEISELLNDDHDYYWGTRQQLLFGKVIADWLEKQWKKENGLEEENPIDPIFGVFFNPTGGRVGPGDSGWFHDRLFDDYGPFAYHSAVHDGFGYLITYHKTGPGYNYLNKGFFGDFSPFGGQLSGIRFWKNVLEVCRPENEPADKFALK